MNGGWRQNNKLTTHVTLGILTIIVILFGFGIAYYQIITWLTLGFLDKTFAFKIQSFIFPVFLLVLLIHSLMPTINSVTKYKLDGFIFKDCISVIRTDHEIWI